MFMKLNTEEGSMAALVTAKQNFRKIIKKGFQWLFFLLLIVKMCNSYGNKIDEMYDYFAAN